MEHKRGGGRSVSAHQERISAWQTQCPQRLFNSSRCSMLLSPPLPSSSHFAFRRTPWISQSLDSSPISPTSSPPPLLPGCSLDLQLPVQTWTFPHLRGGLQISLSSLTSYLELRTQISNGLLCESFHTNVQKTS